MVGWRTCSFGGHIDGKEGRLIIGWCWNFEIDLRSFIFTLTAFPGTCCSIQRSPRQLHCINLALESLSISEAVSNLHSKAFLQVMGSWQEPERLPNK
jgi:hypothetical protein